MEEQFSVLNQVSGVILWSRNLERSVEMYNKLFRIQNSSKALGTSTSSISLREWM